MALKLTTEAEAWDDYFRTKDLSGVDLVGHPDFIAFEADDQIKDGWDTLAETVPGTGLLVGAVRAVSDWWDYRDRHADVEDPNWNPVQFMESNEFFRNIMSRADSTDNPYDRAFMEAALESKNQVQFDRAYERYRRDRAYLEAVSEHPVLGITGTVLGIAPDVAATILMPLALPETLAANAARLTGAGLALRSAGAARAVGASRVGTFGAAEGLGDAILQDQVRTILQDEYIWNTVIGAAAGGVIGGAFPGVVGRVGIDFAKWREESLRVLRREEAQRAARETSEYVTPEAAGSAPSPVLDVADQALELEVKKSPFVAMGRLVKATNRTIGRGFALLSPKTVIAQYFDLAQKWAGTPAGEALSNLANVTGRMFQPNVVFAHNIAGEGRVFTMTDLLNEMDAFRVSRMMEVGDQTAVMYKLIREHYGITSEARARSNVADVLARKMGQSADRMPGQEDLWRLADQIAHMRRLNEERAAVEVAEGEIPPRMITEDEVWHSVERMRGIPQDIRPQIWDMADKISKADDAFYKEAEERLVKSGLLEAADMIPHYRSQLWNQDRVAMNPSRFRNMIYRVLEKEPDQEWVNKFFYRELGEGEDAVPSGKFWEDGETWADVYKRDPEVAEEVLDEWGFALRKTKVDELKARKASIEEILEDYQVKDAAELEARFAKDLKDLERWIANNEKKYARLVKEKQDNPSLPVDEKMAQTENRINKYYYRAMMKEQHISDLNEALGNIEELNRLQKRFRTENRAKTNVKLAALRKAEERISKKEASRTVHELVSEIQESIGTGSGARISDLPMDRIRSGNTRLMKRMLHLKDEQFSNDAEFFLSHGAEAAMMQYTHTLGRRLAFIEAMQPYLNKMRPGTRLDGTEADIVTLNGVVDSAFESARRAHANEPKVLKMLEREQKKSKLFIREQLEAWNNIGLNDARLGGWMEVVLGGTAAHALGSVVLTQATDIPTAALALPGNVAAGAFTKTLFENLGRTGKVLRETLDEIKNDDYLMYSALRGLNSYETMRWEKMVDTHSIADQINDIYAGASTGKLGFMRSLSREGGKFQAWVSLAPQWNRWVQTSFGHVFMDAMNDGIMNWGALKQIDKEHFARLGIGERQAATMRKLLSDPSKTRRLGPDGKLMVPIREQWPVDTYKQYLGAIRRAQNEALIAPEIGDMPALVMRHPLARLVYQFSSFAFAWSGQVMRKAIQRQAMHPSEMRTYAPLGMGLAFGAMVMYLKNSLIYGKSLEEITNKAPADLIWDTMSRTPFVTGMGNSLMEGFFQLAGHGFNQATGMKILPEEPNYFKRQQGMAGMIGPAFGIINGTYVRAIQQAADGDHEKAMARVLTQLPLLNTVAVKSLYNLYGD